MTTISPKHFFTLCLFSLCIFLIPHAFASAQSCTAANAGTVCWGGEVCEIRPGSSQGTCQPAATNTLDSGANDTSASNGATLVNPLKVNSLEALLDLVLIAVIRIGTIILVLMLVWVGFLFVTARGNEEKIRDARRALLWTIIGGLILLGARGLSAVIQSTANAL